MIRAVEANNKADPTWEITQLKAKLQSAEEALNARTTELVYAKDELREVKRQLGCVEKARDMFSWVIPEIKLVIYPFNLADSNETALSSRRDSRNGKGKGQQKIKKFKGEDSGF